MLGAPDAGVVARAGGAAALARQHRVRPRRPAGARAAPAPGRASSKLLVRALAGGQLQKAAHGTSESLFALWCMQQERALCRPGSSAWRAALDILSFTCISQLFKILIWP